jgi:DNA-directed RNA polymerase I subunit RPA49
MSERKGESRAKGAERSAIATQRPLQFELLENKELLGPVIGMRLVEQDIEAEYSRTTATAPGINFPSQVTFAPYKRTEVIPDGATDHLHLHSSDHPRLDYTAQEEPDGSAQSELSDYIGVFDPATNKLQIVPVKRVVVRSTLRSETEEMREQQANTDAPQTMMVKRHALATEFGSKKSRKVIGDMTLNAIASGKPDDPRHDAVAENIRKNMVGAVGGMPTKEELAAAVDSSKPRPTPNLAAEYPGDVYSVDTVVGSELMTMLEVKDWVAACDAGQGINVSSRYVARRILPLAKNKQITKLKVLRFILLCIDFAAALSGAGGNRARKIPMKGKLEQMMGEDTPVSLVMAIRRKFAPEEYVRPHLLLNARADDSCFRSSEMPRWNIDNLMTHIAAAALVVDDHEVDVNDLRDDLRIDNKAYAIFATNHICIR